VKAVEAVLALDPLPDAVLISGDLADTGAAAEYERVRELLTPLPMPVHLLPGNHDRLEWDGPYAADVGDLRLIACDTTKPGEDATSPTSNPFRGLPDAGRPALRLAGPHEDDAPHDRCHRTRRRRPCRRR
jgi:hypothetical protein